MMHRSSRLALAAAALLAATPRRAGEVVIDLTPTRGGYRSPPPHRSSSGTPVKPYRESGPVLPEGGKAAARRRRQIERGQLKAENGLMSPSNTDPPRR